MRLLILPRYGPKGANSRYRLWQYVPLLEKAGFEIEVKPMLCDDYVEQLYSRGRRPFWPTVRGYLRGIARVARISEYDVILLDQELVPYLPPVFERLLAKLNSSLIVDYDDAAYCKYSRFPILRAKIGRIMSLARAVVVGNHHLAEYAGMFTSDVRLIPTVVDLLRYEPKQDYRSHDCVRICWIGTPITAARFLRPMQPVFSELQRRIPNVRFRLIGAGHVQDFDALQVEYVDWSEETEADSIAECDIGIMPLEDDEFERGKCGLKLVQYMAAGLPVVASPVGENRYIVDHGGNGYLATGPAEWVEKLSLLIGDRGRRGEMGMAGRGKVEQQYSLPYGFGLWNRLLQDLQSQPQHLSRAEQR